MLSIEDHVTLFDGRKVRRRQEGPRWIDEYKVPGQSVGLRHADESGEVPADGAPPQGVYYIASSPYDARRDSSLLDAALIEVLVDRNSSDEMECRLSQLAPGALLHVSGVVGEGYASLFDRELCLANVLEGRRNLLLLGAGHRGIAPLRAAIEWTPLQAHATAAQMSLYYAAAGQAQAAYLKDWDTWRNAGINVVPCYSPSLGVSTNGNGSSTPRSWDDAAKDCLESCVFGGEGGLEAALGGASEGAAVLVSGLHGDALAALTRRLIAAGVDGESILYCDF